MYTWHSSQPKPKPQSMLALMDVSRVGNIIGNDKIAVNVALLLVFEAIAELSVSTVEMPKLPNTKTAKNNSMFSIGLPKSRLKSNKLIIAITNCNKALNSIFDKIMA